MSQSKYGIDITLKAGAAYDTSTALYHVGYVSAANTWTLVNTNTCWPKFGGVLQNDPKINQAAQCRIAGTTKLYMNDTCTAGDVIICNTAGAGDDFTATTATVTSNWLFLGVANEASAATGTVIEVILRPMYGTYAS